MRSLLLLLAVLPALAQAQQVVQLSAGMHLIRAEVAADMATRSRGLMFRKSLAPNAGMVFLFEDASQHCMWMKNTYVPLSVAFLDESGTIINIEDMAPQTEDTPLRKQAGALRAGDGARLVRRARHQARHEARRARQASPLERYAETIQPSSGSIVAGRP